MVNATWNNSVEFPTPNISETHVFAVCEGQNLTALYNYVVKQLNKSKNHMFYPWSVADEVSYYNVLGVIYGLLCVIGLTGNTINAVVLGRCGLRRLFRQDRSAHVGFIFLAVADALVCLICFPRAFIPDDANDFDTPGFQLYYTLYGTHIAHMFMLMSTWMTVQLAVGRCVIVFDPLKSNIANYVTGAKTFIVCFCLIILAVLFSLPQFWTLKKDSLDLFGSVIYFVDQGALGDSKTLRILNWIRFIFGYAVPFILLLTCNIILAVCLIQSDRKRQRLTTDRSRTNIGSRITPTLMSIIIVYLLLMTPSEILEFIFDGLGSLENKTNLYILTRSFANILQVSNYAINFALHIGINRGYRQALRGLFRWPFCKNKRIRRTSSTITSSRNSTTKLFRFISRGNFQESPTRESGRRMLQHTLPHVKLHLEYSD